MNFAAFAFPLARLLLHFFLAEYRQFYSLDYFDYRHTPAVIPPLTPA